MSQRLQMKASPNMITVHRYLKSFSNWHQAHPLGSGRKLQHRRKISAINSRLENLNISFDLPAPDLGDLWWTEASPDQSPSWDGFRINLTSTKVHRWIRRTCSFCGGDSPRPQAGTKTQPQHQHTPAGALINSSRLTSYLMISDFSHVSVCFRWVIKCKVYHHVIYTAYNNS